MEYIPCKLSLGFADMHARPCGVKERIMETPRRVHRRLIAHNASEVVSGESGKDVQHGDLSKDQGARGRGENIAGFRLFYAQHATYRRIGSRAVAATLIGDGGDKFGKADTIAGGRGASADSRWAQCERASEPSRVVGAVSHAHQPERSWPTTIIMHTTRTSTSSVCACMHVGVDRFWISFVKVSSRLDSICLRPPIDGHGLTCRCWRDWSHLWTRT